MWPELLPFRRTLAHGALGACRLLGNRHIDLHTGKLGVDHDAAAVLTHNDFLVHLDLHLALRRDAVEAAATSITLDIDDAKTIAGILADALEGIECALIDLRLKSESFGAEFLLVLFGLVDDLFELLTLEYASRRGYGCGRQARFQWLRSQLSWCRWHGHTR